MTTEQIKYWTVLIEVGYYVREKSVPGVVNDVQNMETFLSSGSTSTEIAAFTATPHSNSDAKCPKEDPKDLRQ